MFSTSSTVYTAKCQARALAAVVGESERHRFMIGTCSVRDMNEIVVVDFDEELNSLQSVLSIVHPGEVSIVCSSPFDVSVLATHGQYRDGEAETVIWHCPEMREIDGEDEEDRRWGERPVSLNKRVTLATRGSCPSVTWCPKEHGLEEGVGTVDASSATFWDASKAESVTSVTVARANAAAWSPHAVDELGIATHDALILADRRSASATVIVESPHDGAALDVDYNPNKPYCLATAGDDGFVKFWDTRGGKTKAPLKLLCGADHGHWVTSVKYNRFHDQLLASASTNRTVNLWRVSSISSAPLVEADARNDHEYDPEGDDSVTHPTSPPTDDLHASEATAPDLKVKSYDLHDDSVYGLAWSNSDAWVFAGLSYDGRLVLNHVPSPEKYKILL